MEKDLVSELPQEIYSVESVRQIDRNAIDGAGISGYSLMTCAAETALDRARATFPDARRWQIVCGSGNNGGDGYVLARLAKEQGMTVVVISLATSDKLRGDARTAFDDFLAAGGECESWRGALDDGAELLVDGLLGSGLERPLEGNFAAVVMAMNQHAAPVLALDIPSGLNGDTGAVMGVAVQAHTTVTFVGLKSGLFLGDGPQQVGNLSFADLSIPSSCRNKVAPKLHRMNLAGLRKALPLRARAAHKGDFGHVVLVGGGPGMPGAVRLAGEAALRAGAGRVTIATHSVHAASIVASRPELMCHATETSSDLERLLTDASVVALGPGLGKSAWAVNLFDALIELKLPLVLDADALNLLAANPQQREDWILTPHPGEAARLLGTQSAAVQADRRDSLAQLQSRFGGTIVLKGSGTLISATSGPDWLCTAGNPGMAAPGMGDVLTGIIAALWAQGLEQEEAAVVGVEVHARAGDEAAISGERGMLAGDLMKGTRAWVNP